jgi:hypothetical protein
LQEEILNHLELLYPKDRVVSVKVKGRARLCQVRDRKRNASESAKKSRNVEMMSKSEVLLILRRV